MGPLTIKKIPVGSGSLSRSKIIIIPAGTFITNSLQESALNNNTNVTIREVRNSHFTNSDSESESDSNNSVELNKSNYSRISPKTQYHRSLLAVGNLTKEEKLQRREMKNRLAAQHCRDKRRIKMEQMEMEIQMLKEKNR